jgi:DNA-binding beta-propeller fold protein YncE
VPPSIGLHRNEQFLEDFQPPEHAVKVAKGHSALEELRDSVVSFAYGSEKVLMIPQSVTTDSRRRVIVTDPVSHGLHVLAYDAKESFQIVGGPSRRLQSPNGVAVDGNDNIYVSDSERGMILVYDSGGRFVRTIGSLDGEGIFEHPSSIAIDRKSGILYVLDPPRHALVILDLDGKMLARVGSIDPGGEGFSSRAGSTAPGRFSDPKAVLIHNNELVVLDATRVHILDLRGMFLKEFKIPASAGLPDAPSPGLFMDDENRIYVSDPGRGIIRVYNHDGQFLRAFGKPGVRMGEFNGPAGMWADSNGRVYIVDARRVQIFRFIDRK